MGSDAAGLVRYVVEWYAPRRQDRTVADVVRCLRRSQAAMPAAAHGVELLYALEIPNDAYMFGVFAADSADAVACLCDQAGFAADRVSAAVEAPAVGSNQPDNAGRNCG